MKRREFLTGMAGAAALSTLPAGAIRAFAQNAAGVITFGQSTAVLTLDPAHGASPAIPAATRRRCCSSTACSTSTPT